MEVELHSLNSMRSMEIVDILTGSKIGFIKDFKIDCDDNRVISLILPGEIKSWFGKTEEREILWEDIVKIGTDVILVRAGEKIDSNINNM